MKCKLNELKKRCEIESKILNTNETLSKGEIMFLRTQAHKGVPLGEFDYGLYFLLVENDEKQAEDWWNKFFYHSNGYGLWKASYIFAFLGDEYYEWSMKCLRRSAWKQFNLSKMMLKEMKKHPFSFPEC